MKPVSELQASKGKHLVTLLVIRRDSALELEMISFLSSTRSKDKNETKYAVNLFERFTFLKLESVSKVLLTIARYLFDNSLG